MIDQNKKRTTFLHGAEWLRADFHLHTKADKQFSYTSDPEYYYSSYINKLEEQKIKIAAITNHNKFEYDEYKALYKTALKKEIYLLPGVELSVKDGSNGIHSLVIFNPKQWLSDSRDYINQFLTSTFAGKHNFENRDERSNDDLIETIKKLNDFNKDYFIILAHIEQTCGFCEALDGGRIIEYGRNPLFRDAVLAFQKVRTNDIISKLRLWFDDKLPAFVEGSDPKKIEEIGIGEKAYIKIGDYNFEAVKYALLDHNNRVTKEKKPAFSNAYIKSIRFEGGKLDGIHLNFSSELNTLIGIRGSGKSAILELIRYTLGIQLTSVSMDTKYKNDLIQFVLGSGGKSILRIVNKNGEEYQISKIYGQKEDIFRNDELIPNISLEGLGFDQPIFFGQKDLSNKDADFESDLLKRLIGYKLTDKQIEIEHTKKEISKLTYEISQLAEMEELKKETNLKIHNANERLVKYKELGVEEKLKQQTQFDTELTQLDEITKSAITFSQQLSKLIENYNYFFSQTFPKSDLNNEIFDELSKYLILLKIEYSILINAQSRTNVITGNIQGVLNKLTAKKEGLKDEFARIKREINSDNINPDDFLTLNRIIETSKLKLLQIEKSEGLKKEFEKKLHEALLKLNQVWLDKHNILKKETDKINSANNKLSINVEFKGKKNDFKAELKDIFRGTGINESSYNRIAEEFNDFIELYKDNKKLEHILNENQRLAFMNKFNENLNKLLVFEVENEVVINYNGKPLSNHSLGQRASALILFLLAQNDNSVLIIDQPEDDLDNQTIYNEVIKEVKNLKGDMQFIFATHNANIPVLGDSEQVISCIFDDKKIEIDKGSIDNPGIQNSIVKIMEGGEEAFSKRKSIYTIWNIEGIE